MQFKDRIVPTKEQYGMTVNAWMWRIGELDELPETGYDCGFCQAVNRAEKLCGCCCVYEDCDELYWRKYLEFPFHSAERKQVCLEILERIYDFGVMVGYEKRQV